VSQKTAALEVVRRRRGLRERGAFRRARRGGLREASRGRLRRARRPRRRSCRWADEAAIEASRLFDVLAVELAAPLLRVGNSVEYQRAKEVGGIDGVVEGVEIPPVDSRVETYREANPAEVATPEQSRFYDPAYRPELRKMVDHVISVEGPIYFDLLVDRISCAHNFQRARHAIRNIIRSALGRGRYPHTQDDGQELIWPAGADTKTLSPWRAGGPRHHSQVPLVELAGLVRHLLTVELNDEDLVRNIQEVVGLARLATPTRERFLRAIETAPQIRSRTFRRVIQPQGASRPPPN
jgi:Protein of unknown function (DUF3320)